MISKAKGRVREAFRTNKYKQRLSSSKGARKRADSSPRSYGIVDSLMSLMACFLQAI